MFRLGIATRAELRLTLPDYFDDYSGRAAAGFGDLMIGTKLQLGPTPGGFDVSLIATSYFGARWASAARSFSPARIFIDHAL